MRTTLQHLTPARRELVDEAVEFIKETVNPEMIILFGSYANGKFVEQRYVSQGITYDYTSDLDFLVVTKGNTVEPSELHFQVFNKTEHMRPSVNMEIHEIDYINEGLSVGQYFFSDIIKEGVLLYDKKTVQFQSPKKLTPKEEKEIAERYFEIWIKRSKEFFIDSNNAFQRESLTNSIFYLHQSTESLYYSMLLVFTGYKPKTHNLFKLRKQAKPFSENLFEHFQVEKELSERELFDLLKRAYLDARYNPEYAITADQLQVLIDRVEQMQAIVEKVCKEKIASFTA